MPKEFEYEITAYNYTQKCNTIFELKAGSIIDLMEKLQIVMTYKEIRSILKIERV